MSRFPSFPNPECPVPKPQQPSSVVPALQYRDAPAAIDWLCRVFGFEKHFVVPGDAGTIAHAQLSLGGGMIMLGSARKPDPSSRVRTVAESGGFNTQLNCLVVPDPDVMHARVREAGGEIVQPLRDEEYGGRSFICADPEGFLWHVSNSDPWAFGD